MLVLKRDDYQKILEYAREGMPNEVCGLLGGKIEGEDHIITEVYLLTNMDHSPKHFSMNPKEQFAAGKDMRAKGTILLGNFHSHPQTPSWPSKEDVRLAFDATLHYLILSTMEEECPVLHSFHIEKGVVTKEEMIIL